MCVLSVSRHVNQSGIRRGVERVKVDDVPVPLSAWHPRPLLSPSVSTGTCRKKWVLYLMIKLHFCGTTQNLPPGDIFTLHRHDPKYAKVMKSTKTTISLQVA